MVKININTKCKHCNAKGYLQNGKQLCGTCQGSKIITETVRMGPMIQQSRRPCPTCQQKGYTIISFDQNLSTIKHILFLF